MECISEDELITQIPFLSMIHMKYKIINMVLMLVRPKPKRCTGIQRKRNEYFI